MNNQILFVLLALLAGMMIPFQSAMNAQLSGAVHNPYYATLCVFVVAAVAMAGYIGISRAAMPQVGQFASAPWWSYLGGILGGAYILLIVLCAPKVGIGNVTVMVLLGQLTAAMLVDQFGLLRAPVHPINLPRLAGLLLIAAGVYLVKKY